MKEKSVLFKFWEANQPGDEKLYGDGAWQQRNYFEKMGKMAGRITGLEGSIDVAVLGSHTSKSITLPVVEYSFPTGAKLIVRDNFYNFAITIDSPNAPVTNEMIEDIFSEPDKATASCYCEGFPSDRVYGAFYDNPHQFTGHIWDKDRFAFFMISFAKLQKQSMGAKLSADNKTLKL